jgi:hypothetical protein
LSIVADDAVGVKARFDLFDDRAQNSRRVNRRARADRALDVMSAG